MVNLRTMKLSSSDSAELVFCALSARHNNRAQDNVFGYSDAYSKAFHGATIFSKKLLVRQVRPPGFCNAVFHAGRLSLSTFAFLSNRLSA